MYKYVQITYHLSSSKLNLHGLETKRYLIRRYETRLGFVFN